MRTNRLVARAVTLTLGVVATSAALVVPASANQLYPLTGTLNTSGTLVQYGTYRPHTSGGANFALSDQVGCSGNRTSRFGLRINDSSQYTQTLAFNSETGSQAFRRASDGSSTLATNSYAVNGRMANETGHGCDNKWAGSLFL